MIKRIKVIKKMLQNEKEVTKRLKDEIYSVANAVIDASGATRPRPRTALDKFDASGLNRAGRIP